MRGGAAQLSQWPHGSGQLLAEARQQRTRAAGRGLGERDHLLELGAHHALLRLRRGGLRQPVPRLGDVLPAIQQQRLRRIAVAAGAADLLVVRLGAVRHVEMHDEAHVRPVDPHAEGDRRDHHHRLARAEPRQRCALRLGIQSGVEGDRGNAAVCASLSATRSVFARVAQ